MGDCSDSPCVSARRAIADLAFDPADCDRSMVECEHRLTSVYSSPVFSKPCDELDFLRLPVAAARVSSVVLEGAAPLTPPISRKADGKNHRCQSSSRRPGGGRRVGLYAGDRAGFCVHGLPAGIRSGSWVVFLARS